MKKKIIAITGSSGVVGNRFITDHPDFEFDVFSGDIKDFSQVRRFLNNSLASCVLHLAAIVPRQIVDKSPHEAVKVNVGGTLHVLEALRQKKEALGTEAPYLFYASTSHVYASSPSPLKEDSEVKPLTLYGLTKYQGEEWCAAYERDFKLKICVARFFSFSDRRQSELYFIPAMFNRIRSAPKGATLEIGGVRGTRDFLRVPQISKAIRFLIDREALGTYNIGTGHAAPLLDVIKNIATAVGRTDLNIIAKEDTPSHLTADISKLKSLGFHLESEINELISEMAAPS